MQCSCGGATAPRTATDKGCDLNYQACNSCGRVGGEELYINAELVATGAAAREQFNQRKGKGNG